MSHPRAALLRPLALALALGCATLLAGCAEPAPPPTASVAELAQHPGEHALLEGLRNYENGAFEPAEANFKSAVQQGLHDRRDTAVAYKHLAFIACAFNRPQECEANFRAAFAADPNFRLTDAEIGHPIWGPVYRRVAAARPGS
jgi:tetratricopeptide (TPR) repeat protein